MNETGLEQAGRFAPASTSASTSEPAPESASCGGPRPERLLALDTATERMALAVAHGALAWHVNAEGGAQASSTLIPTALAGLSQCGLSLGELDAVACGIGPGAFTGLRSAVAVSQGLAFGAGKPVLAIDSLLIVAEDARGQAAAQGCIDTPWSLWVVMDARMDEIYAAAYVHDGLGWQVERPPALYSLAALQAVWQLQPPARLAGSALAAFGARLVGADGPGRPRGGTHAGPQHWPQEADRAAALLRLARAAWRQGPTRLPEQLLPTYLRDKVALTTAEREALKALTPAASSRPEVAP